MPGPGPLQVSTLSSPSPLQANQQMWPSWAGGLGSWRLGAMGSALCCRDKGGSHWHSSFRRAGPFLPQASVRPLILSQKWAPPLPESPSWERGGWNQNREWGGDCRVGSAVPLVTGTSKKALSVAPSHLLPSLPPSPPPLIHTPLFPLHHLGTS